MPPVATPRNLGRLPHHHTDEVPGSPGRRSPTGSPPACKGWRIARRDREPGGTAADGTMAVTISAEKGYIREVGNLVFHLSLLGLLVAIAVGKMVGYEGSVIVNVGSQFCSTSPASYDNFRPGLLVDGTDLAPFCVDVQSFTATYTDGRPGQRVRRQVRAQSGADAGTDRWQNAELQVNEPLRMDGERLYLLGHGFTPHFQITYPGRHRARLLAAVRAGARTTRTSPRRARSRCSTRRAPPGTTVRKQQLAIVGIFAPTAFVHGGIMTSSFPAPDNPGVGDRRLPRRPGHGGRPLAVGVLHRHLPGGQGAADQAGAVQPDGRRVGHPGRRHPDHLHRLQRVGVAADLVRSGAAVGAGVRGARCWSG